MEEKSAYVMIKIDSKDRFVSAYKEIYSMDNIISCDATKGIYDLVLLLKSGNMEELPGEIKKIDGIKEADFMPLTPHIFPDRRIEEQKSEKNNLISSYVMVEIEKEKLEKIYTCFSSTDKVISCHPVEGKFDIVLLIESEGFDDIDRVIKDHIRNMDGVLRIKECPVIGMLQAKSMDNIR